MSDFRDWDYQSEQEKLRAYWSAPIRPGVKVRQKMPSMYVVTVDEDGKALCRWLSGEVWREEWYAVELLEILG